MDANLMTYDRIEKQIDVIDIELSSKHCICCLLFLIKILEKEEN